MRTQWGTGHLQAGKRVFTENWPCWYLWPLTSRLQKINFCHLRQPVNVLLCGHHSRLRQGVRRSYNTARVSLPQSPWLSLPLPTHFYYLSLSFQICPTEFVFKGCYNKWPQTWWDKTKFFSRSSEEVWNQGVSRTTFSLKVLEENSSCLFWLLVIPWPWQYPSNSLPASPHDYILYVFQIFLSFLLQGFLSVIGDLGSLYPGWSQLEIFNIVTPAKSLFSK